MKTLATLLLLTLNACGPDVFTSIAGDAGPETQDNDAQADSARDGDAALELDADADAAKSDASCPYVGSVGCSDAIGTYCAHYAACCSQFPGNGKCSVGFDVTQTCKNYYAQNGYDCNSGKFNKFVCGGPSTCMNNTSMTSCNVLFQSTGPSDNTLTGCPSFWSQFP